MNNSLDSQAVCVHKMEYQSNAGMKPIFIVFQMLALYPLQNHVLYTIYTIASFSVGIWMLGSLHVVSPVTLNHTLRMFIGHLVFIIRAIVPMLIIAQVYLTRSEQEKIFSILDKIDEAFERNFAKNINYKRLRVKYLKRFFAPFLTVVIIRIYYVHHLMTKIDENFRFYWFHCVQSLIVSRIRCMQVGFYAILLNDRIEWIHEELVQIRRRKSLFSPTILEMKIVFLRQIYGMIYDVSVSVNKSVGWSLLVITISYFVDYVGNCYLLILLIEDVLPVIDEIGTSVGMVTSSIALVSLYHACGRCSDNVSFTSLH